MAQVLKNDIGNRFASIRFAAGTYTQAMLDALTAFDKAKGDKDAYGWVGNLTQRETNHPGQFTGPFNMRGLAVHIYPEDPNEATGGTDVALMTQRLGLIFSPGDSTDKHIGPAYAWPSPFGLEGNSAGSTPVPMINNGRMDPTLFKEPIQFSAGDQPTVRFKKGLSTVTITGDVVVDFWFIGEGYEATNAG